MKAQRELVSKYISLSHKSGHEDGLERNRLCTSHHQEESAGAEKESSSESDSEEESSSDDESSVSYLVLCH